MAIKTFTTGEVLTAADTNTYLANSGLVYVAGGALSSTATNFAGCFTSAYRDYRIVIDSVALSGAGDIYMQMLSGTTPDTSSNYFWYQNGIGHNGAAQNSNGGPTASAYTGININYGGPVGGAAVLDCFAPTLAVITYFTSTANGYNGVYYNRTGGSVLNIQAGYDGIRFLTFSAVTMSGNVSIYGYRKA